jgi:hypothetical protein
MYPSKWCNLLQKRLCKKRRYLYLLATAIVKANIVWCLSASCGSRVIWLLARASPPSRCGARPSTRRAVFHDIWRGSIPLVAQAFERKKKRPKIFGQSLWRHPTRYRSNSISGSLSKLWTRRSTATNPQSPPQKHRLQENAIAPQRTKVWSNQPKNYLSVLWGYLGSAMKVFDWLPPRDSNPDMLIQSQLSYH